MFVLHWGQTKCPVYKRCPDFRVSTFRGSTVLWSLMVAANVYLYRHRKQGARGGVAPYRFF